MSIHKRIVWSVIWLGTIVAIVSAQHAHNPATFSDEIDWEDAATKGVQQTDPDGTDVDTLVEDSLQNARTIRLDTVGSIPAGCEPANDRCRNATRVYEAELDFDTSCATTDGDGYLYECRIICESPCFFDEIWYDFVSPCDGAAQIVVFTEGEYAPTIVAYDDCGCIPFSDSVVACNGLFFANPWIEFDVVAGRCYKVKIGNASTPGVLQFVTKPEGLCLCDDRLGDVTGDGRLDARDYAALGTCFVGGYHPVCTRCFDFDDDGSLDLRDFAGFQNLYTGW